MTCIKISDDWKEDTRIKSLIWKDSHALLKNDLYISGIINLTRNNDDDDDKKLNLINLNDKTNTAISFNNENLKWIIGTGIDNNVCSDENFSIININNGCSGVYLEPNNGNWYSLSDLRLKNIISNIDQSLDKIKKIRAVYYTWKQDATNIKQVGVIAQDVLEVFKEAVSIPKDPNTQNYGVSYTNLIPLLLSGIQELDEKVNINSSLLSNNNSLINTNNNLIFELKEITDINKKFIDLKQAEIILLLNNKINEINDINNKQQNDIEQNLILSNNKIEELTSYINNDIINIINIKNDDNKILINNKVEFLENLINTNSNAINYKNNEFVNNIKCIINENTQQTKKINDDVMVSIEENNDQVKYLEILIKELNEKNNKNTRLNTEMTDKLDTLTINHINILKKYNELEQKNENLKIKNQDLIDNINILNTKNNNLELQVNTLNEKMDMILNNTIVDLTNKCNEQQKYTNINKNKIEILQNMMTNLQKKYI